MKPTARWGSGVERKYPATRGFVQLSALAFVVAALLLGGGVVVFKTQTTPSMQPSHSAAEATSSPTAQIETVSADAEFEVSNAAAEHVAPSGSSKKQVQLEEVSRSPSPPAESAQSNETTRTLKFSSGVVVEVDGFGNVIRVVSDPTAGNAIDLPSPVVDGLLITNVRISPTFNSATLHWETSVPTESKVFWNRSDSDSPQVTFSNSGVSTIHSANLNGLSQKTSYSFTIEALQGGKSTKQSDAFTTPGKYDDPGCAANPQLTLAIATTSVWTYSVGNVTRDIQFEATYTTGCRIDEDTPFNWEVTATSLSVPSHKGNGVIGSNAWQKIGTSWDERAASYLQRKFISPLLNIQTVHPFEGGSQAHYLSLHPNQSPILIKITVGNQMKYIVLPEEPSPFVAP